MSAHFSSGAALWINIKVVPCIADGIPILMRLINSKDFVHGPFSLGFMSPVISVIALLWISFITVSNLLLQQQRMLVASSMGHCNWQHWQHLGKWQVPEACVRLAQIIFVLPSICERHPRACHANIAP